MALTDNRLAAKSKNAVAEVPTSTMTNRGYSFGNGTVSDAGEAVCRKRPRAAHRTTTEPLQPLFLRTQAAPRAIGVTARPMPMETILRGRCWVIDGDTIVINNIRLRLAGIDAPELDHPWGQRSKWALVQLCKGQTVTARIKPDEFHTTAWWQNVSCPMGAIWQPS